MQLMRVFLSVYQKNISIYRNLKYWFCVNLTHLCCVNRDRAFSCNIRCGTNSRCLCQSINLLYFRFCFYLIGFAAHEVMKKSPVRWGLCVLCCNCVVYWVRIQHDCSMSTLYTLYISSNNNNKLIRWEYAIELTNDFWFDLWNDAEFILCQWPCDHS